MKFLFPTFLIAILVWCAVPSFAQTSKNVEERGEHHYEMATKYIKGKKIKKAIAHLDTLIMLDYELTFAYIYRAQMNTNYAVNFRDTTYFDQALLDYMTCEKWYADAGSYWFNRAMCEKTYATRLQNNSRNWSMARNLYNYAKAHFTHAIAIEPEFAKAGSVDAHIAHIDDALKRLDE